MASVGLVMGVAVTPAGHSLAAGGLDQTAEASAAALALAARRLSELASEAAALDERSAAVAQRERDLEELAGVLAEEHAHQIARAAQLQGGERALAQQRAALTEQESIVASREALLVELQEELLDEARAFEERAQRFHWRWFLRAWVWRPRLRASNARVCELFFVPSVGGYKLLEQSGVAVTPRARISGLLDERTVYVVTKLAQLPFDGRWCAYLEIDEFRGGEK
jgi:hypothetical protein